MFLDISFLAFGTSMGFIAGLIPGVGNVIMLLMLWPFLFDATMQQMLLFYLALISACQFSGSVVATVFGVPGESSSMPAVYEGNKMFHRGVGNYAISNAAIGSVLGSAFSVLAVYALLPWAVYFIQNFYNNNVQIIILFISVSSILFLLGTNLLVNIGIFALGFLLSMVGWQDIPFGYFLADIVPYDTFIGLKGGIPFFPVVVALYVFPVLLSSYQSSMVLESNRDYEDNTPWRDHFKEFGANLASAFRGSAFGAFIGLVPHVGTSIASNLSYAVEKRLGIKRKTYNKNGDIKSLVAAETANNSTGFTSMMPLLLLGIPITTSEAILLSLIDANSFDINYKSTLDAGMFETLVVYFVLVNIVCFTISWPMVQYVNYLKKVKLSTILALTMLTIFALVCYNGYIEHSLGYFIGITLVLMPIGYMLRKTDPLIVVIAFVLQDRILQSCITFCQINF